MSGKIRRGTMTVNGEAVADIVNLSWKDSFEFDRRAVDNEMHGKPVQMKEGGSGSFELLAGNVASGYAAGNVVISYTEVSVSGGEESETAKTVTFEDVTFNSGGNIDNDAGPGSRQVDFEYGAVTEA